MERAGRPETRQIFLRQVHASHLRVFFYVANDVGELKGDPSLLRQLLGARVAIAEDANADQTDDRRHVIAVIVKLIEGLVLELRRRPAPGAGFGGNARERPSPCRTPAFPAARWNFEGASANRPAPIIPDRRWLACHDATQRVDPFIQLFAALLRRDGRVVGDVVGMAHEGIHRRNGIALGSRQDQEAVVEILGGGARDVTTNSVGGPQLSGCLFKTGTCFPRRSSRPSSRQLARLEMTGRRVNTSYPWCSMASRISSRRG